jgi:hypothetical protein
MIQRIQSVWLFLAALLMALLFYFPTYKFSGSSALPLSIGEDFLAIIMVALSIILSLVTISKFKNRKHQISLTWLNILVCIGLQVWLVIGVKSKTSAVPYVNLQGYYWMGLFIPIVTIILLFMAKAGISKDQKLVKSLDRLR